MKGKGCDGFGPIGPWLFTPDKVPGDVISTGTPPGVGMGQKPARFLAVGDEMRLGITGLSEQRQRVLQSL